MVKFLLLLAGMLNAAAADAACKISKVGNLPVEVTPGGVQMVGAINGHEVRFILSTGVNMTFILPSAAKALGLTLKQTRASATTTSGGHTPIWTSYVEHMSFGGWSMDGSWLTALGDEDGINGTEAVGIIGRDVLKNYDIEFNLKDKQVGFYKPEGCESANLAYWTDNYNVVDLEGGGETGSVLFKSTVNGRKLQTLLATDILWSELTANVAEDLGMTPDTPNVVPAAGVRRYSGAAVESWIGKFDSFSLDQEEIKPAYILFHGYPKTNPGTTERAGTHIRQRMFMMDLSLGLDFMQAHRILISQVQRKMYFSYVGGPVFQKPTPAASQ